MSFKLSNAAKQSWFMIVSELIEFSLKSITEISMQTQNKHLCWTFDLSKKELNFIPFLGSYLDSM